MILRSLKDRVESKFRVFLAELEDLDKWQSAVYGLSLVSGDHRYLNQCLQNILSFIGNFRDVEISDYEISFV